MTNTLLNDAIKEIKNLKSDEVFLVKDLFKGYKWNRIPVSDRMRLGILFLNYVESNKNVGVNILKKTSSNQQKYEKN